MTVDRLRWRLTRDPRRQVLAALYGRAATAFVVPAVILKGSAWVLLWPALALAVVALAYLGFGQRLFGKQPDGRIDWPMRLLLAPYLAAAWLNSRLWTRHEPRTVEVTEGVWLGRFPSAADCRAVASVVDLTSECTRPAFAGDWTCLPMLDLVAPDAVSLAAASQAIERAHRRGPVLVCCALGYGRSVASLAVWLVRTGRCADVEAAFHYLRSLRPHMALNDSQRRAVREAADAS
jgi:protein-tyrosine phosphatase